MTLQDLWYAREATVKIGTAWSTISTTDSLDTDFDNNANGTEITAQCKEVRIGGGTADVEVLHLFGDHQAMDERRPELRTAEFTLIYQDEDIGELRHGTGSSIGSTGYNRIQGADNAGCRTKRAILFSLNDCATDESVNILLNNAYITDREISLTNDGHVEETLTAKCLLTDYYEEYKES